MELGAQSVVLDLLSAVGGKSIAVRALVGAGALFGIKENALRVAVARLVSKGKIERNGRGRYGLTAAARPVQEHVASWTNAEQRMTRWAGSWIGVHTAHIAASRRAVVRRMKRALTFLGFRELDHGLWLRPDNLKGGIPAVRERLLALGLDAGAFIYAISELQDDVDARARGLWNAAEIEQSYHDTCAELAASAERLPDLSQPQAMVEYFVVGGRAIRRAAYDPLLPEPIVSAAARRKLVTALRRYDQAGRSCWRDFMRQHGAPALAPHSYRILRRSA